MFPLRGPPQTVANCSEGTANWTPSGKGLAERIHIASLHECVVMSLRNEITGSEKWTALYPKASTLLNNLLLKVEAVRCL